MNMKDHVCGAELPDELDKSIVELQEGQHRAEEQFLRKLALLVEAEIKEQVYRL
ncbi:hypothetical protein [Paenibacillus aceti]|uniref:Transposase n=1 Tax=Paenibacillus aceti TaxID=1820010 RepID=A0ABQ1W027_9BACL|nr:hypothetical protein [Paenibacillus aceti]GGG07041.1 hypothetical protein GCM10010913_31070 [Paenibacillus aceti]